MPKPLQIAAHRTDLFLEQLALSHGETWRREALFVFMRTGVWCIQNLGREGDVRVWHSVKRRYKRLTTDQVLEVGPERFAIVTRTAENVHLWQEPDRPSQTAVSISDPAPARASDPIVQEESDDATNLRFAENNTRLTVPIGDPAPARASDPIVQEESDDAANLKFAANITRLRAESTRRDDEQAQLDRFRNPVPFDEVEEQALTNLAILATSFEDDVKDMKDAIRKLQQDGAGSSTATPEERAMLSELQEALRGMMSTRYTDLENNHSVLAQLNQDDIPRLR